MTISIAIATHNEEKHIADCLKSVDWADEVVVVDGESIDNTVKISKKFGAKVFEVKNQLLMKINMNLSFAKCTSDWILQLDADERVNDELKDEILRVISENPKDSAFRIPRKNLMFGKWMEHSGWYPDPQLRLFKNGKGKYPAKNVHEDLEINGTIGNLEKPMTHLNWETISQFLMRFDSYTTYEARRLIDDGKKVSWTDAIKFPLGEFLSRFFDHQAYKDGLHGLVLSLFMAFYWEMIFAKIWEQQGFWQYGGRDFLEEVNREVKGISLGYHHWLTNETKNPIQKLRRRLKNKIGKNLSW